jgi:hypothetical protein
MEREREIGMMSAAKTVLGLSSSEARARLVDATALVCETSFLALATLGTPDVLVAVAGEGRWYHATVSFDGPSHGSVHISVPEGLARELFGTFLGFAQSRAAGGAIIEDVMGEFVNMVCGVWLTMLGGEHAFTITPTAVRLGGLPAPEEYNIILSVNDRPTVVRADLG